MSDVIGPVEEIEALPVITPAAVDPLQYLSAIEVLDTIPDAVSVSDTSGRIVYLNDAWARLIGISDREAALNVQAGERGQIRSLRPDGTEVEAEELAISRAIRGEVVHESEIVLVMPDGRRLWLQTNAEPIRDQSGRVIGAIASSHDITTLRELEARHELQRLALAQKVREFEMTISSMADGVLITDAEGNTRLTNPAFDTMIGHELAHTAAPKRFHELHFRTWSGEPLDWSQTPVARALSGEQFSNEEFLVTGASGRDVFERVSGGPLCDPDGTLIGAVLLVRDVTHLHEADREKNEFISLVAHELRTPITLIRGFSQLLQHSLGHEADPETGRRLSIIDRRSEQLSRLISDLLDVTRMEIGAFGVKSERLDYRSLVNTVSQDMAALRPEPQVQVRGPERVWVQGDPLRIQQVLINLIDNAFTHGPEDGPVRVILRREGGCVVTRVIDEGPGIPENERERVFDRFYQQPARESGAVRGIGLGLYISRRIVEAHGGRIWIEDGGRSCFAFSLPMAEAQVS